VEENFSAACQAFEEAIKISEEVKDFITPIIASYWFGMALSWNCEFERAVHYIQRAVDINIAAKSLWGTAVMKANLSLQYHHFPGKINLGFQNTAEALRIAEQSGDIWSKGFVYNIHGTFSYGKGLFEVAEKQLLKGIEFCERINEILSNAWAHVCLGEIYFEMGHFPKSKDYYEKGYSLLEHNRACPSWVGLGKVGFARSKAMNNEKDVDLESLYTHSRNNKMKVAEGWVSRYIGEILLNIDNQHTSQAELWIQKAIEEDGRNGMMFHLGRDYALYAELFKRKGDRSKAQENLGRAIEILKECGADGWVSKYEKELALIS
jgi:tetratricopeptide (TPR) repeat protein